MEKLKQTRAVVRAPMGSYSVFTGAILQQLLSAMFGIVLVKYDNVRMSKRKAMPHNIHWATDFQQHKHVDLV